MVGRGRGDNSTSYLAGALVALLLSSLAQPHEHIMRKAGLDESPVGIKIAGRNINLIYADDTTLMAESEEELKRLLMRVKEKSTKVGLELNIKKTKIMASGPIASWQIHGEEMEVMTDFIFLGSKITAERDCNQEIKRRLLLGRKAMANLDSILKSRDITLPTKVHIVKAMVFPVAIRPSLGLKIDQALLQIPKELLSENLTIYWLSDYCYQCLYQELISLPINRTPGESSIAAVAVDSQHAITLMINSTTEGKEFCSVTLLAQVQPAVDK
ncbi:Heparan-alpha-glucosaminide N-acetyltransferase [Varanus komodoensis]|nr:Heparan-alpha-glucosaminide N-acetyltransferase [Varanus komodoensis]